MVTISFAFIKFLALTDSSPHPYLLSPTHSKKPKALWHTTAQIGNFSLRNIYFLSLFAVGVLILNPVKPMH